jgi:hypothetical protein
MKKLVKYFLLSLIVLFVIFVIYANYEDPEKKVEYHKEIQSYQLFLNNINKNIEKTVILGIELENTDAELVRNLKGEDDNLEAISIYYPTLKKYTSKDTSELKTNYDEWAWLTHDDMQDFDQFSDSSEYHILLSLAHKIKRMKRKKMLAVIYPDATKNNNMPIFKDEENFVIGEFSGWVLLVNIDDSKIIGKYPVSTESSETIEYQTGGTGARSLLNENPKVAVKEDFINNFKKAIEKAIPEELDIKIAL